MEIKVVRNTTESNMTVKINDNPIAPDYRNKINTSIMFLDHMIEHIVWRSGFNIEIETKMDSFVLAHCICEDLGITLGKAFAEYLKRNIENGTNGYGDAIGIIDEAKTSSAISFESRAYIDLTSKTDIPVMCEGMASEDLETFLEGFVQGANCTLHIDIEKGKNAHHIWEATFRSFGIALGRALKLNPDRANMTAGVAGKITFEIL